jgi:hypothetical protein
MGAPVPRLATSLERFRVLAPPLKYLNPLPQLLDETYTSAWICSSIGSSPLTRYTSFASPA